MKRPGIIVVAFVAGLLTAGFLIVERSGDRGGRSGTELLRSRNESPLRIPSAQASDSEGVAESESVTADSPPPEDAREERLRMEAAVRTTGPAAWYAAARTLISAWKSGQVTEGVLDQPDGTHFSSLECFGRGCILTFTHASRMAHEAFFKRQMVDGGLLFVWPGSKFSSALDESLSPAVSSWVLYFDEEVAWQEAGM